MDRDLSQAVKLEEYTDEDALNRIRDKTELVKKKQEALRSWSDKVGSGWEHFKDLLVSEFGKLGAEFDTSELEASENEAMEQWAIKDMMQKMHAHLGADIDGLNEESQVRLAMLAQRSGKELAALMANKNLTDAELATKIAELNARSRAAAAEILSENGHMKLDQATTSRNLKMAIQEVENSAQMIAKLEVPQVPPAKSVEDAVKNIRELLNEVNRHMDGDDAFTKTAAQVAAQTQTATGVGAGGQDAKNAAEFAAFAGGLDVAPSYYSAEMGSASLLAVAATRTAAVLEGDAREEQV